LDELKEVYIDVARNCLYARDDIHFKSDINHRSIVTVGTHAKLVQITNIEVVPVDQYGNIMKDDLVIEIENLSLLDEKKDEKKEKQKNKENY